MCAESGKPPLSFFFADIMALFVPLCIDNPKGASYEKKGAQLEKIIFSVEKKYFPKWVIHQGHFEQDKKWDGIRLTLWQKSGCCTLLVQRVSSSLFSTTQRNVLNYFAFKTKNAYICNLFTI